MHTSGLLIKMVVTSLIGVLIHLRKMLLYSIKFCEPIL